MSPRPPIYGLLAEYENLDDLLGAVRAARREGYRKMDAYTPFPAEEVAHELGLDRSRLPWVVFAGGLVGCVVGYLLQYWTSVIDYPLNVGGRPLHSWPAFIPVTFEMTILVAAFTGVRAYVERLRRAGARVDLHVQAALGEVGAARAVLEREPQRADERDEGELTPLMACAGSKLPRGEARELEKLREIAALLLDAGADPNARVRSWGHDVDVAYFAVSARHAQMLELLLRRGADATAALPSALWSGLDLAALTLENGASIDGAREGDRPILNELVRWGQIKPVLWLLERGASPNVADPRGWTAVHQAASRGNERMLRALLDAGGDTEREDEAGRTPQDVARLKKMKKLAVLLASSLRPSPRKETGRAATERKLPVRRKA